MSHLSFGNKVLGIFDLSDFLRLPKNLTDDFLTELALERVVFAITLKVSSNIFNRLLLLLNSPMSETLLLEFLLLTVGSVPLELSLGVTPGSDSLRTF